MRNCKRDIVVQLEDLLENLDVKTPRLRKVCLSFFNLDRVVTPQRTLIRGFFMQASAGEEYQKRFRARGVELTLKYITCKWLLDQEN